MDRRVFLQRAIIATAGSAVVPAYALSSPVRAQSAEPGDGPYGPLLEPDENGLRLPEGFTSRVVAVAGEAVEGTDQTWHAFPDGAACFPTDDGGWIYTCNSEVFEHFAPAAGGVTAVRFDADGAVSKAYRILEGSNSNCAGGPTPWGTWLSCEENFAETGRVWECDPTGAKKAVAHPAMGLWAHEAVAVDEASKTLYLTQDHPTGNLYRYTPKAYPDLAEGLLESCVVADDGAVTWAEVPDPSGKTKPTREQVSGATLFNGGEGIWSHDGVVYFTTKGDHTVHSIDIATQRHEVIWKGDPDGLGVEDAVLSHVDNITVDAGTGDLYVAEDGGNMEVVVITAEGVVAPFAQITGDAHEGSEVTGPCFNPDRTRLYFSSQRGPSKKTLAEIIPGASGDTRNGGVTYEVTGPFRGASTQKDETPGPTTTLKRATGGMPSKDEEDSGGLPDWWPFAAGGLIGVAAGAALALRNRTKDTTESDGTPTDGAETD